MELPIIANAGQCNHAKQPNMLNPQQLDANGILLRLIYGTVQYSTV